jgi:hypothetical protein
VTSPGRGGHGPPDNQAGGSALLRGGILVGIAFVIGFALLAKGFEPSSGGSTSNAIDQTTTTAADDGTTTSTTLAAPHQPAEVKVYVLNGSGLVGVAQQATDILNGRGYTTIAPQNAPAKVPATVVYYVEGYQADGLQVAAALGAAPAQVQPMPAPGTNPAVPADTQAANVVVVLGPDFKAG